MTIRKPLRTAVAVAATALALAACDGSSKDSDQTKENAMYCDLIDPQTVAPIVGDSEIKDFGGPVPKTATRMFNCNLYFPEERKDSVAVFEFEIGSDEDLKQEQAKATQKMSDLSRDFPERYESLEDGDDVGYAWFDGTTAAANLLTADRHITVTVPATAEQATTFTPLMLTLAQEIDTNLDAWDAENP